MPIAAQLNESCLASKEMKMMATGDYAATSIDKFRSQLDELRRSRASAVWLSCRRADCKQRRSDWRAGGARPAPLKRCCRVPLLLRYRYAANLQAPALASLRARYRSRRAAGIVLALTAMQSTGPCRQSNAA